jgi:16S rRNA (cytosine967-C5)-methyltransferase
MTAGLSSRRVALTGLNAVFDQSRAIEGALDTAPGHAGLSPSDRGFARAMLATLFRRRGQSEAALSALLSKPWDETPPIAQRLLLLGATQLLWLDSPPHAVVATMVELAETDPVGRKLKRLINAVLRRLAERREEFRAMTPARANLPEWLAESWAGAYGEDGLDSIAEALLREAPLDLTLRSAAEAAAWAERLGAEILPTGSLRLEKAGPVPDLDGFEEGAWWVQDAAAALPARLLAAQPGERIADYCAAPGGKTLQLAAAGAQVTALDISKSRLRRLSENLDRTGLAADIVTGDLRRYAPAQAFDAILLDAPCSATGTARRHPETGWIKSSKDMTRLAEVQRELGGLAADHLKPGGRMVICTCSLQPEEGELWLQGLVSARPDLEVDPVRPEEALGLEAAILDSGAVRTRPDYWTERGGLDGFFMARLRRTA